MEQWKKITFIIATVLVVLRIGYIVCGEVDKQYYTSTSYNLENASSITCQDASQTFISNQDRLNSLEFIFDNIADDKAGAVILYLYSDDVLIYQTNISLSNVNNKEWKKVYINAKISANKEYKIVFSVTEECTKVPDLLVVKNLWASEIMASYNGSQTIDGQLAINYGYLQYPSTSDRLVISSLWILLWIAVYYSLCYFDSITKAINTGKNYILQQVKPQVLITTLEIFGCTIIINSSGIEFQKPTEVVLYIISLIAAVNYEKKSNYVKTLVDCIWKKGLIIALYFYAAFALVGQRIWIYPLTVKLTIAGLFVFLCTVAWFIPIVKSILYYLEKVCLDGFSTKHKLKTVQFVKLSIFILLAFASYNLFAYNPGISSPDTLSSMVSNAKHLHGMYDWHPAFYCMVLRVIEKIWDSTYAVIIVQYFFYIYVVIELLLYLRKKNVKDSILLAVTLFTGLNAGNYIHINTIWKDIPYTLSLLWAFVLIAKLSIDFEEYRYKWYIYFELVIALIGVCLYRKNGMVSFVIIAISTALVLRKNIRLVATVIISTILIFVIKGPLYNYFEIVDSGRHGIYIGLGQDILGVYYAGGEVSESTLQMINVMTSHNNAEYSYNPTWSNQSYDLDVDTKDFIVNYIDTFIKNPVTMIRAVIDREDALWDIYAGEGTVLGCVNYTGTMDENSEWAENYPKRKYVSLYPIASTISSYTATSQWISAIEWRCGLFMLLGIIAVIFLILKNIKRKYLLIIAPAIGHIMSLLLSTGWSDFRYFWPMNLLNMAMILVIIVIINQKRQEKNIKSPATL